MWHDYSSIWKIQEQMSYVENTYDWLHHVDYCDLWDLPAHEVASEELLKQWSAGCLFEILLPKHVLMGLCDKFPGIWQQ